MTVNPRPHSQHSQRPIGYPAEIEQISLRSICLSFYLIVILFVSSDLVFAFGMN